MPPLMAIPCGYGAATLIVLIGSSFDASPIDHRLRAHAAQVPVFGVVGEDDVFDRRLQPGTATTLLIAVRLLASCR